MLAIKGGTIYTITNGVIKDGVILVDNGKIKAVGKGIPIPGDAQIIDASDKWITPGLIDAHTHIGNYNEPQYMPGVNDGNELSCPNAAEMRALDSFNPRDMAVKEARDAGFTTCCSLPGSCNVIGGTGIVYKTIEAETVMEMLYPDVEFPMKMAFGENPRRLYGPRHLMPTTRMGNAAILRKALYYAKRYSNQLLEAEKDPSKAPAPDFQLDALVPVVRGIKRCRIHAHRSDDIVTASRISEEYGLKYSIEHATEAFKIIHYVKEHHVQCVIGPLQIGPVKMEMWENGHHNPVKVSQAGIEICLTQDDTVGIKWLPNQVGLCMGRGMSEEAAFRAVTINPARLLEVDHRVGSIEPGKDADFAIFNGHPFCNFSLCVMTLINGEIVHNYNSFT